MPAKKIVLSGDPELLAILENSFFQREGFEMVLVQNGQAGFKVVEAEAPTLAIFDLALLGEQALKCCRAIKQDQLLSTTPVLLLLPESTDENLADACWEAGCDAVIHRPLAANRLLDAACGLLGISRRLARRFPVNFQLEFLDSAQKRHLGSCVNFNDDGMFLATEMIFPMDTTLLIDFVLPGFQTPLQSQVRVAWVNHPEWRKKNELPCGMGVQFVGPSALLKAALKDFVSRLSLES